MKQRRKPIVGETLYSLNVGNNARNRKQELTEVKVTKVGKKFFYCGEGWQEERYFIDNWVQDTKGYSATSCLYESREEWAEERECSFMWNRLREFFGAYGGPKLPINALREIIAIIDRESGEKP